MWSDLLYRLRAVFRRNAVEAELDNELRFHFDREVDKRMRAGISRQEAERQARLAIGGIEQTKEHCRQSRGVSLLEGLLQDIGYAFRVLKKSPGFTAAVALSLALGIGANTAIFSLIDAVMWKSLPVKNPESLWVLSGGFTYRQHQAIQRNDLADLAAYSPVRLNVSVDGSVEPTAEGLMVSGTYFSLLGVNPVAGRAIGPDDDRVPNGHTVAMISHGYWKRRFALSPNAIGGKISLCGTPFTIIGVTPPEFFGIEVGTAPDIFVPVMMQPAVMPSSENLLDQPIIFRTWLRVVGRLRPGVHPLQAASAIEVLRNQEMPQNFKKGGKFAQLLTFTNRITLTPATTGISSLRSQFSQPLFLLMVVVGVVLLIACANTANLLLARAAARRPEFAVRLALGAGRRRLMRQLLVESVALAALGGVCGILLARLATQLLVSFLSAGRTPIVLDLNPDLRILAFTAAVSLATGILFGFAPALRATRIDLVPALKNLKASSARSGGGLRPGKVLAITQVALSLVLLVAAGLFVRSLRNLNSQDSGFERDRVLIVRVEPRGSDQRNIEGATNRLDRIYKDLLERVESIPSVQSATLAHFNPTSTVTFGSPVKLATGEEVRANSHMVYPNYFATMGIPIVAGRDFQSSDLRVNSPPVILISEALARQAFPGENALGKLRSHGPRFRRGHRHRKGREVRKPPGRSDALDVPALPADAHRPRTDDPPRPHQRRPRRAGARRPGRGAADRSEPADVRNPHAGRRNRRGPHPRTADRIAVELLRPARARPCLRWSLRPARLRSCAADRRDGHSHRTWSAARRRHLDRAAGSVAAGPARRGARRSDCRSRRPCDIEPDRRPAVRTGGDRPGHDRRRRDRDGAGRGHRRLLARQASLRGGPDDRTPQRVTRRNRARPQCLPSKRRTVGTSCEGRMWRCGVGPRFLPCGTLALPRQDAAVQLARASQKGAVP